MALGLVLFAITGLVVQGQPQDLQSTTQCKWQASWTNITVKPVCLYEYIVECPAATFGNMKNDLCNQCRAQQQAALPNDIFIMCWDCGDQATQCDEYIAQLKSRPLQLAATSGTSGPTVNNPWFREATVSYFGCFEQGRPYSSAFDTEGLGFLTQGQAQANCQTSPFSRGEYCKTPLLVEYPCTDCFLDKGPNGTSGKIPFLMKECCDRCLQFSIHVNNGENASYPEFASVRPFVYCDQCHQQAAQGIFKDFGADPDRYISVSKQVAHQEMDKYIDDYIMPTCKNSGPGMAQVKACPGAASPAPAPIIVTDCTTPAPTSTSVTSESTPSTTSESTTNTIAASPAQTNTTSETPCQPCVSAAELECEWDFMDWLSYDMVWLWLVIVLSVVFGWVLSVCALCCPRIWVKCGFSQGPLWRTKGAVGAGGPVDPVVATVVATPSAEPNPQQSNAAQQGTSSWANQNCNIQ